MKVNAKDEKVFKDKLDTELDNYMKQGTTAFGFCFKKHVHTSWPSRYISLMISLYIS